MSQTKAHPETPREHETMKEHIEGTIAPTDTDPIPLPEEGGHAKSHAAHLRDQGHVHAEAEGNRKQGVEPGALRQPASIPQRNGKEHR